MIDNVRMDSRPVYKQPSNETILSTGGVASRIFALCLVVMIALASGAAETDAAADGDDAKAAAALVQKLGAESYKDRRAAAKAIRALEGPALVYAVEALRKTAKSDDPELRLKATAMLPELEARCAVGLAQIQQRAAAKKLKIPVTKEVALEGDLTLKLVLIPGGEFDMGSKAGGARTTPIRRMKIQKPFYMGAFEVTQKQYQQVMGVNPSREKGDALPVAQISWQEAREFCTKLSKQTTLEVRLPTEAEWEYACRAGTTTTYTIGDDEAKLDEVAWYDKNSDGKPHEVGKKAPNGFGLHDMLGNVWEFCEDDWHYGYREAPKDDRAWVSDPRKDQRVIRGGAARLNSLVCTSAHRSGATAKPPSDSWTGFRVAVSLAPVQGEARGKK